MFKALTLKGHLFPGIGNVIEYLTKGLRSLYMIDFKIDKDYFVSEKYTKINCV